MSDISTDYNKRTCIICGCHTSQTINIYEPRNGPNIIQLIQARFKFQPLNDDKYLCYSCNNWLINWHSLQALNSNNADSSLNNFRLSNVNNTQPEMGSTIDEKLNTVQCFKPIAIVRPRIREHPNQLPKDKTCSINENLDKRSHSKLGSLTLDGKRTNQRKFLPRRRVLRKSHGASSTSTADAKCKNDCESIASSDIHLETHFKKEERQSLSKNHSCSLVSRTSNRKCVETLPYLPRRNQRTLIDGKVVSMLRRIGTTLSRDVQCTTAYQPSMAAPTDNIQKRMRDVADDEILINFNTAISEVLSYNERKSSYDIINIISDTIIVCGSDDEQDEVKTQTSTSEHTSNLFENNGNSKINLQQVFSLVPKGLSVSLITNLDVKC